MICYCILQIQLIIIQYGADYTTAKHQLYNTSWYCSCDILMVCQMELGVNEIRCVVWSDIVIWHAFEDLVEKICGIWIGYMEPQKINMVKFSTWFRAWVNLGKEGHPHKYLDVITYPSWASTLTWF